MDSLDDLTIAICTNRIRRAEQQLASIGSTLRLAGCVLVIIDGAFDSAQITAQLNGQRIRGRVEQLIDAPGLSHCRNLALKSSDTPFLLFLDDDALPTKAALFEAVHLLRAGAVAVGARLVPKPNLRFPWFITHGQYHLLGVHSPFTTSVSIWGAFMAIDMRFASEHGLWFANDLGRARGGLQSGDDSSFILSLQNAGGRTTTLHENQVIHDFCASRLTLRYIARRSWWQGRSEVRRAKIWSGLGKEVTRYLAHPRSAAGAVAALVCVGSVIAGIFCEGIATRATHNSYRHRP